MHRENFVLRVNFFHGHSEFMTSTAENTHETGTVLKGDTVLGVLAVCGLEPLEFIRGFAAE